MKEAKLKTLEQSDNVSLYSICFDGNAISEYETFVQKFKDDATQNTDDKMLAEAQKAGTVTIEKNVITGIEGKVFQLS